jgi:hypothetical protein
MRGETGITTTSTTSTLSQSPHGFKPLGAAVSPELYPWSVWSSRRDETNSKSASNPELAEYGLSAGIEFVRSEDYFPLLQISETNYEGTPRRVSQSQLWSIDGISL